MAKKKVSRQDELLAELKDLFLRDGTEMASRGFFQKAKVNLSYFGGSVDKNMEQLARIREIIIELTK